MTVQHRTRGPADAHGIMSWVYASLAARNAHQPSEGSNAAITVSDVALHRICFVQSTNTFYTLTALDTWESLGAAVAAAHAETHENGGDDEISVTGLSGLLATAQIPATHATSHTSGADDIQSASATQKGLATAAQITKLDGIAAGADVTGSNPPQAHASTHTAADAIRNATAAQNGLATSTHISKLDGIEAAADVTANHDPKTHAASHVAADAIQNATAAQNGLATSAQITKLDGITAGANITNSTSVNAAGAVMETDYAAYSILAATSEGTPVPVTFSTNTLAGRTTGAIDDLDAATVRALLNVSPKELDSTSCTLTSYTLSAADNCRLASLSNASEITVTIPTFATASIPVGAQCPVVKAGAGNIRWAVAGGVTVNGSNTLLTGNSVAAVAYQIAQDSWYLWGALEP